MDNGKPAQGKVIGRPWNSCTNAASRTDLAGIYQTTSEVIVCQLIMRNSY